MSQKKNKIYLVLLAALLVRIALLYPQFSGDVKNHFAWGNGFLTNPIGFYGRHFPGFNDPNYPPMAIFLFAIANLFLMMINSVFHFLNATVSIFPSYLVPLFSSENMQMGFLKLPAMLSDIGTGWLLFQILSAKKEKWPLLLAALYLFNPAVLYISSVWGQIESITIFFLIFSLYLALFSPPKYKVFSIIAFILGALTKQTALWFVPFYFILWIKEIDAKNVMKGAILSLITFFVAYIPFGLNPLQALTNYFSTLSGSSSVVADAAWNFWFFLFPNPNTPDSTRLGILTVRQLSIILLGIILFVLLLYLIRKYSWRRLFNVLFLWSLAAFFLQTRVHERHLAFAIPLLLLTPGLSRRYFLDYVALSAYHFSNLYLTLRLPFIK